MAALFGCATDRFSYECSPGSHRSRRSRSRGSDSANFSDKDDDRRRGYPRKHRVYDRGASYRDEEMLEDRRSSYDYDRTKHRKSVNSDISDRDSNDSKISADMTRSSRKRERDSDLTRRSSKSRRDENYSDRRGYSKEQESGRYREHKTKSSGSGKDYNSDLKENPNVDICGDKQQINKGRDSLPKTKKEKSLDINSVKDRLDRDKDRYHRHSKKSSRKTKKETELSDIDSHGGSFSRDEKNYRKDRKKVSRSKSEIADADSDREKLEKEEERCGHRRKSSKHHSKGKLTKADYDAYRCSVDRDKPNEKEKEKDLYSYGSHARHKDHYANLNENQSKDKVDGISEKSSFQEDNLCRYSEGDEFHDSCTEDWKSYREGRSQISGESNERNASSHEVEDADRNVSSQDSYRQSETQIEQAYRLAALKKLEELKKSKDTSVKYREQDETMVIDSCDRENLSESTEFGHGSSKVDRTVALVKRRRI